MKNQAMVPAKQVAIREISLNKLFNDMSKWSNDIAKRAYELFVTSGFTNGHDLDDWLKAEQELLKPIALDVKDLKDHFVVTARLPGFDSKDLDIHLNGSRLVITGKHDTREEKKEKKPGIISKQCKSAQVYRMIELPGAVVADRARAELKNGVLELKLPKVEKAKQLQIAAA
jgi:HSP20 family protein